MSKTKVIRCWCLKGRNGFHCPLTTDRSELERTFNYRVRGEEIVWVDIDASFVCPDEKNEGKCHGCPFYKKRNK